MIGGDEDQLKAKLKVLHSSYPSKNLQEILVINKENMDQLIFPMFVKMIKTYATLPISTASVERSVSKLKKIRSKLKSLGGEEQLSELLLFAIEQDIQTNNSELIRIFQKWNQGGCSYKEVLESNFALMVLIGCLVGLISWFNILFTLRGAFFNFLQRFIYFEPIFSFQWKLHIFCY